MNKYAYRMLQTLANTFRARLKQANYRLMMGEGHFGAADSALDNSAPCRFGAGHFGAVS